MSDEDFLSEIDEAYRLNRERARAAEEERLAHEYQEEERKRVNRRSVAAHIKAVIRPVLEKGEAKLKSLGYYVEIELMGRGASPEGFLEDVHAIGIILHSATEPMVIRPRGNRLDYRSNLESQSMTKEVQIRGRVIETSSQPIALDAITTEMVQRDVTAFLKQFLL